MQEPIIPAHIIYDPRIATLDIVSEMVSTIISDTEIMRLVHLRVISMGVIEQMGNRSLSSSEKAPQVDLHTAFDALASDYVDLDKKGIGTRANEVLILLGTDPVNDWFDDVEEISARFPLIITYWFDKENLDASGRQKIDRTLERISPADSKSGAPRHKIILFNKDQDMRLHLQDIFEKFKNRLRDKVCATPSIKKG